MVQLGTISKTVGFIFSKPNLLESGVEYFFHLQKAGFFLRHITVGWLLYDHWNSFLTGLKKIVKYHTWGSDKDFIPVDYFNSEEDSAGPKQTKNSVDRLYFALHNVYIKKRDII